MITADWDLLCAELQRIDEMLARVQAELLDIQAFLRAANGRDAPRLHPRQVSRLASSMLELLEVSEALCGSAAARLGRQLALALRDPAQPLPLTHSVAALRQTYLRGAAHARRAIDEMRGVESGDALEVASVETCALLARLGSQPGGCAAA